MASLIEKALRKRDAARDIGAELLAPMGTKLERLISDWAVAMTSPPCSANEGR